MNNHELTQKSIFQNDKNYKSSEGIRIGLLVGAMVVMIVAQFILNPKLVSTPASTMDYFIKLLFAVVSIGLMAAPSTLVMISGNIDLSVGSILMFSAMVSCTMARGESLADPNMAAFLGIIIPLFIGLVCGALNGLLVGVLRLNAFISTLGSMYLFQGFAVLFNGGRAVSLVEDVPAYRFMGGMIGDVFPVAGVVLILVFLLFGFLLHKTVMGRKVYASGGNRTAAEFSGINVKKTIMSLYLLTGIFSGLAGLFIASWTMTADNTIGNLKEFDVMIAIILGGVSMAGGKGTIIGTVLGVFFLGVLDRFYVQFGIPIMMQWIIKGVLLAVVVYLNGMLERKQERRKD